MNKATVVSMFKESFMSAINAEEKKTGGKDMPMRREAWNNYIDMLRKDGKITEKQYMNWDQPAICK
jgi:hypothetical protein